MRTSRSRSSYPSGSQAVIVYSAGAPRGAGKERVEIMRGDRSAEIDDYPDVDALRARPTTETVKYKPADKGHNAEFVVFREAIEGKRDGDELDRVGHRDVADGVRRRRVADDGPGRLSDCS